MNNIKKQFVTYEIALNLKELGFDEECLCTYAVKEQTFHRNPSNNMVGEEIEEPYTWQNSKIHESVMTAPLYQQVIDWFREKHQIHITYIYYSKKSVINWIEMFESNHFIGVVDERLEDNPTYYDFWVESYGEAREQAILKAIESIK